MTVRKVWLGSTGPFLYDDSVLYIDEDGVISPDNQQAIATDGQIVVQSAPSSQVHVIRKQDLDDALGDITALEARVTAIEAKNVAQDSALTSLQSQLTGLNNAFINFTGQFTYTFFDMSLGGWTTAFHGNTYYVISDKIAALLVPAIDSTSAAASIDLGGFPDKLRHVIGGGNTSVPVLCYADSFGWQWANGGFTTDPFWHFRISPYVGGGGLFPTTGRKILAQQVLVWAVTGA